MALTFWLVVAVCALWMIVAERRDRVRARRHSRDPGGHVEVLTDDECERILEWIRSEPYDQEEGA